MQSHILQVVIVGGGFGGLHAARALRQASCAVTLIDQHNYHLFQPLLYQVATGGLSPANIAAPLRALFKRQRNVRTVLGRVTTFDPLRRKVVLEQGELAYDRLILATGAENYYYGHPKWAARALGLKTVADATRIRAQILTAFERAEQATDPAELAELLTFVVIGGGPTGLELAGAISEIAHHTLAGDFRRINPADARVVLIEGGPVVLGEFPQNLSANAAASLKRLGIQLYLDSRVVDVTEHGVTVHTTTGANFELRARTVLWAAGVQATPLGRALAEATGCAVDRGGRVMVLPDLSVPSNPEIFVIGDLAQCLSLQGLPLPGIAPVAIQQGRFVAGLLRRGECGGGERVFRYRHFGNMVTIGRALAVADLGLVRLSGILGWLAWLLIHLMYLVSFDNRVLVLFQWCWYYVTWNRSARLIAEVKPDT